MTTIERRVGKAVKHFWSAREKQGKSPGTSSGVKDYGTRSKVTGGKQLDGFIELAREILIEAGLPSTTIFIKGRAEVTIPGFFRPTKNWDLLVVADGYLLAALEFKSQVGSFGNNYNNRTEEAIGNATDLWTAYRHGAYAESPRPWLGYFSYFKMPRAQDDP